jgi:ABC-type polysaccharide/polyol phosphate export permease
MNQGVDQEAGRAPTNAPGPLVEPPTSRIVALLADSALAITCYFAAYRLRFEGADLSPFLSSVLRTIPLVAGLQIVAITATGTYVYRQGRRWLPRLLLGVALGTAAGASLTYMLYGFAGISRISFVVDALLLTLSAFAWRSAAGLARLARAAREEQRGAFVLEDRTAPPTVSAGVLGIMRYRELLRNLVFKDLKLKYRGSVFGFVWSLAHPLLMVAVYTLAFTYVLQMRSEGFVFLLLVGLLTWGFFASSATMATRALVDSGGLIRSAGFPRAILPLASVLFNFAQFLLTLAVLLPLALVIYRVAPAPVLFLFPAFLLLQVLFMTGVALALSTATAFYRDVQHLVEVSLNALFWTTPIVYAYQNVPEHLRLPILLSPVSSYVVAYQEILYYGRAPAATVWLVAFGYASAAFVLGASFFVAHEDQLAEHV